GLPRACKFHDRYGSDYSQNGVYPFPFFMETDFPFPLKMMSKRPNYVMRIRLISLISKGS
ncbi:hypothetical protein, partial [Mesorhizobium sp. M7A.F.Ca.ET.027.02.1.1]|uniref:hypothetical protein n=1 Tax=Mesorhizobium sp. M7A.F.Ca.ET.027.02.1.1 TaxID=2496655 RepID=UPI001AECA6E7